jgi:hypothetical protein
MAEIVKKLNLERNYKTHIYYVNGKGDVCRKVKSGKGEEEVLHPGCCVRDNDFLYYIDRNGDLARSPRAQKKAVSE